MKMKRRWTRFVCQIIDAAIERQRAVIVSRQNMISLISSSWCSVSILMAVHACYGTDRLPLPLSYQF